MLTVLKNRTYARLFGAQVVALLGTGLLTIALGLIAYDLAGGNAGQVLGIALTIKMLAYVFVGPVLMALIAEFPRKAVLVVADLIRAVAALCLPFVTDVWQIYVLIFVLQSASAVFTPTFQAVIPGLFKEEAQYTRALGLSRFAYDLENLLSPVIAGLLLTVVAAPTLFIGTGAGFVISSALVVIASLPVVEHAKHRPFWQRLTRGSRIYLATPRLRGLLALNMALSAVGAVLIVNTVVIVRGIYGGSEVTLAVTMGASGAGSMLAALTLPRVLDRVPDRPVMLTGAAFASGTMLGLGTLALLADWPTYGVLLGLWFMMGLGMSSIATPAGRLLARSSDEEDRAAVYAAQFALSHAAWMLAYPMAGFLGPVLGQATCMIVMAGIAGLSVLLAIRLWPAQFKPSESPQA